MPLGKSDHALGQLRGVSDLICRKLVVRILVAYSKRVCQLKKRWKSDVRGRRIFYSCQDNGSSVVFCAEEGRGYLNIAGQNTQRSFYDVDLVAGGDVRSVSGNYADAIQSVFDLADKSDGAVGDRLYQISLDKSERG